MTSVRPAIPLSLCALAACTAHDPASDLEVERTVVGDTTLVRTLSGSVWGDSVSVVEELRIGVLEGPEEYQFGGFLDLAVDAAGGIYVFDNQVPALRYYDATGAYVRTVGGEGQGPGEYGNASLGLAVRRGDGRLVMRDARNMRLNVYEPDGSHSETWRAESGLYTGRATALDTADHLYLKILAGPIEQNEPWPIALMHLDETGAIVDTIVPPTFPDEPTDVNGVFAVAKQWAAGRSGGLVVGVSDRYRLDHLRPDGTVLRIERDAEPVPVLPVERREHEARNDWRWRTRRRFMTAEPAAVPDLKPFYREIVVGEEGRIWVRRHALAEKGEAAASTPGEPEPPPPLTWHEPVVYDAFEPEGSFLGTVRFPPSTTPMVFRGDRVWGVRRGELDEPYVVRLRISHR